MTTKQHTPGVHRAFFRFFEELNDFLEEKLRERDFAYEFKGNPSIKDTLEAIGVPHTEIDIILVDGKSVGFNAKLYGGEIVSVYPAAVSLNTTPLFHLRAEPLPETKFVVDVHLGKLAEKLRLLGFDTLYRNDFADPEIVDLSLKERRIILTRDRGILKYSVVRHGYWVRNNRVREQLREVVQRLHLEDDLKPFTRCSNCNNLLQPVDKSLLQGRLPPDTMRFYSDFAECEGCRNIYWKGSHYHRICELIDEIGRN